MKNNFFQLVCALLVLSMLTVTVSGQDTDPRAPELGTIIGGNGHMPGTSLDPGLENDCIYSTTFTVMVANLEIVNEGGNNPTEFFLPASYPTMILRVTIGGNVVSTVPVDVFEPYIVTQNGIQIYRAQFDLELNLASFCAENSNNGQQVFSAPWEAELLQFHIAYGFTPYPLCAHTSVWDIFACDAFEFSEEVECPLQSCDDETLTVHSGVFTGRCNECRDGGTREEEERVDRKKEPLVNDFDNVEISPNPFEDYLTIEWKDDTGTVQNIELFDTNGKLVYSWNASEGRISDSKTKVLDTKDLNSGIYFLKLNSGKERKIIKIVKQ